MKKLFLNFGNIFSGDFRPQDWFFDTPRRALREAYRATKTIETIQNDYIRYSTTSNEYTKSLETVTFYVDSELNQYYFLVKLRLLEFQATQKIFSFFSVLPNTNVTLDDQLKKLIFIEKIQNNFGGWKKNSFIESTSVSEGLFRPMTKDFNTDKNSFLVKSNQRTLFNDFQNFIKSSATDTSISAKPKSKQKLAFEKTGIIPRSIPKALDRLRRELLPTHESYMIQEFRVARYQTLSSLKYVLTLFFLPAFIHFVSKLLFVNNFAEYLWNIQQNEIFLNHSQEERALTELETFQEKLFFETLIGEAPELTPAKLNERIQMRALDIAKDSNQESIDSIANLFADFLAVISVILFFQIGKNQLAVVKSFFDEFLYSLSDSVKAFLIILFTDMFVGFHSPHGWEIIIEALLNHLGLPESKQFILLFIATFPVILDTVFKYWIFRYLNQISPSTVATYRSMNE